MDSINPDEDVSRGEMARLPVSLQPAIMKKVRSNGVLSDMCRIGIHKDIKNINLHGVYVCVRRLTVLHHIDMKYITPEFVDLIMNQVRDIQCVKNKKTNTLE